MAAQSIACEVKGGVATITLARPEAMNAFTIEMLQAFHGALERVAGDPGARVLVITGEGRAFCAGGDVAGFHANIGRAAEHVGDTIGNFHAVIGAIHDLDMPVIAGVNGITAGGGMGLFLNTDLAIAAESAVFVMGYTGIGATPDGSSSYFLPRLVGARRAMELTLTNRTLSATEALDWGLVNAVVADADFAARLAVFAETLAAGPTLAYGGARRLIRESFDHDFRAQLDNERDTFVGLTGSDDFREGVAAFTEKRKPVFKGS